MYGVGSAGFSFGGPSFEQLCECLAPVHAYAATGILSYVLYRITDAAHTPFLSVGDELFLQRILLSVDAHGVGIPAPVQARLAKTCIGSTCAVMPYMWKVSHTPQSPGFPVYALTLSALLQLRSRAREGSRGDCGYRSTVDRYICHKACARIQCHWRTRTRRAPG